MLLATLCLSLAWAAPPAAAVINGKDSAAANEFDYVVGLHIKEKNSGNYSLCSGSILKERWILTAGHCVSQKNSRKRYSPLTHEVEVFIGATNLAKADTVMGEKWFTKGFSENDEKVTNDIALIKTSTSMLKKRNIGFANIPFKRTENPITGSIVEVAGFGGDGDADFSYDKREILQIGRMKVKGKCDFKVPNCIHAENVGGRSCRGDSGGPMVFQGVVVGVSSKAAACPAKQGDAEYIAVFPYRHWINRKVANK